MFICKFIYYLSNGRDSLFYIRFHWSCCVTAKNYIYLLWLIFFMFTIKFMNIIRMPCLILAEVHLWKFMALMIAIIITLFYNILFVLRFYWHFPIQRVPKFFTQIFIVLFFRKWIIFSIWMFNEIMNFSLTIISPLAFFQMYMRSAPSVTWRSAINWFATLSYCKSSLKSLVYYIYLSFIIITNKYTKLLISMSICMMFSYMVDISLAKTFTLIALIWTLMI